MARIFRGLNSQSERTFNDIHCCYELIIVNYGNQMDSYVTGKPPILIKSYGELLKPQALIVKPNVKYEGEAQGSYLSL